jgi:hypothetical protein
MSSRSDLAAAATVRVDIRSVAPTAVIQRLARDYPRLILDAPLFSALARELGDGQRAIDWLQVLVTERGKPIAIAFPNGAGTSRTVVLTPSSWSDSRRDGYAAGLSQELLSIQESIKTRSR